MDLLLPPRPENKYSAPPQSMFPKGTTPENIQKMTKDVLENPLNQAAHQSTLRDIEFWQIKGTADKTPLVVGYRKFPGNKPSEITQVYPRGAQYEVRVLPAPLTRKKRGMRGEIGEILLDQAADWLVARGVGQIMSNPTTGAVLSNMHEYNVTLRALSLGFSDEERQSTSISIMWEPIDAFIPQGYYFELIKDGNQIEQQNAPLFTDQLNEGRLTTYFIRLDA